MKNLRAGVLVLMGLFLTASVSFGQSTVITNDTDCLMEFVMHWGEDPCTQDCTPAYSSSVAANSNVTVTWPSNCEPQYLYVVGSTGGGHGDTRVSYACSGIAPSSNNTGITCPNSSTAVTVDFVSQTSVEIH
jgi:hypothetical protein